MVLRVENSGGSYGFYRREPKDVLSMVNVDNEDPGTFITSNKIENGRVGTSLGDGTFIHEGDLPPDSLIEGLDSDLECHNFNKIESKSLLETPYSLREDRTNVNDERIISAQPNFNFATNKAELILNYANGKTKVVKKSCYEIAAWLMSESEKRVIE